MLLNWFDATEAKKFGALLAELLIERAPEDTSILRDRKISKKHEAMLNQLSQHVTRFKADHRLNIYKKAQLGNAFKWALKAKGYDAEYINRLTHWLMLKF